MKSFLMMFLLMGSMATFVSCQGGSGSDDGDSKKQEKKLEVGKERLLEINEKEEDMEKNGHIKFDQDFTTVNNGVTSTNYKIEFTGQSTADAYESKDYLRDYVDMVENLLSDYPSDEYYLSGRDELKVKVKLAKQMIEKINKL